MEDLLLSAIYNWLSMNVYNIILTFLVNNVINYLVYIFLYFVVAFVVCLYMGNLCSDCS